MQKPFISVIIATKNEEKNIANCLESVKKQTYSQALLEVIVVDNASTDKTRSIATKYTDKVFDLEKEIGSFKNIKNFRGVQLNLGVSKAKGEVIFFPDADMTFAGELFFEAVEKLFEIDALFVPEVVCGKGLFGKIRNFERSFYDGTCIDAVRFVKKTVFEKVGGFDEKNIAFGPDDWDFTKMLKKNGYNFGMTEKSLFHHEEELDLRTYISKKGKYVTTFDKYINKWGKNDPDIKKQFGLYYRFLGVFLEKGKWKKMIAHPFLAIGMYYLRGSVGIKFLMRKQ